MVIRLRSWPRLPPLRAAMLISRTGALAFCSRIHGIPSVPYEKEMILGKSQKRRTLELSCRKNIRLEDVVVSGLEER